MFALLGANGSGKTTTINVLTTLLKAEGGTASVAGFDVAEQPAKVRQQISVTGQSPQWTTCSHCAMLCPSSCSPSGHPVSTRRRWREVPHRVASDSGGSLERAREPAGAPLPLLAQSGTRWAGPPGHASCILTMGPQSL